jgi:histidine ammonia-lyase
LSLQEWLSDAQSRAALVVKLTELINSGTIRPAALQFYESILNSQVTLSLPSSSTDAPILRAIAGAAVGNWNLPQIGAQQEKAVEVLAGTEAGLSKPPGLSAKERASVGQGIAASVGVSALAVFEAEQFVEIVDAVAALTCEALGAVTSGFDAEVHDVAHPHKSQVTPKLPLPYLPFCHHILSQLPCQYLHKMKLSTCNFRTDLSVSGYNGV